MIYTNSLTSKGQVTLPKQLRDAIGLKTGTKVKVMQLDNRTIAIRAPLSIEEIRRQVGPPKNNQPLTDKEKERLQARGLI